MSDDLNEEERYAAALPGWRPSTAKYKCPRVVAGKRCVRYNSRNAECLCEDGEHGRLLDHTRLWVTPDGDTVLTAAPYNLNPASLSSFRERCQEVGVHVWQKAARSPYGHDTYFIVMAKRERWQKVNARMFPAIALRERMDSMPKTEIYHHGEDVSVVTTAAEERDFVETFTQAFTAFATNGASDRDARIAFAAGFDVLAKLRGYKSNVQERRLLAAGRWPHPTEKPAAQAGAEEDTDVAEQ